MILYFSDCTILFATNKVSYFTLTKYLFTRENQHTEILMIK
ncbi:hypothetical protein HMPREF1555_02246 [Porphyromonas gingivalis F0570]|uniref:Uncharacterized protein n=1 Tax=Porphyromonas gingivalis F0570 TaxID=1227271 RepID=A0A0E2LM91_PORGN|nr:hypothetical protein HMPREF1555_02246 [Porphyromonas gingivalis F0570]